MVSRVHYVAKYTIFGSRRGILISLRGRTRSVAGTRVPRRTLGGRVDRSADQIAEHDSISVPRARVRPKGHSEK